MPMTTRLLVAISGEDSPLTLILLLNLLSVNNCLLLFGFDIFPYSLELTDFFMEELVMSFIAISVFAGDKEASEGTDRKHE